jgi:hypothetical protein
VSGVRASSYQFNFFYYNKNKNTDYLKEKKNSTVDFRHNFNGFTDRFSLKISINIRHA